MDWKNQPVAHKVFGAGSVIAVENGMMTVAFGEREKKFPYPSAFERFLTAQNGDAQMQAQQDLEEAQAVLAAARAERERRQAEELERRRAEAMELRRPAKKATARRTVKKA